MRAFRFPALCALGCSLALSAQEGWTASPSMLPGMPPEVRSWREEILSPETYQKLVEEWRAYSEANPGSAVALVQLARAHRYARTATPEARFALVRAAYDIDPKCPEALLALAESSFILGRDEHTPIPTHEEAMRYALEAAERAPQWPEPHFNLWTLASLLGRPDEAVVHARALAEKGAYPAPVMDFAYNLLVSAESQAILFTNGDNDTYPPLALQAHRGIRSDVVIANLSLLNRPEYAIAVLGGEPGEKPFSADEIQRLHDEWKAAGDGEAGGPGLFSLRIVRALAEKVGNGEWKRPVYFASTVVPDLVDACPQKVELEGLLWRVTTHRRAESGKAGSPEDAKPKGDEEKAEAVNLSKTLHLVKEEFRLESATDLAYAWTPTASPRLLMLNYAAILNLTARASADRGDLDGVRHSLGKAIEILDFLGFADEAREHARYWKELDPNGSGPRRWLE